MGKTNVSSKEYQLLKIFFDQSYEQYVTMRSFYGDKELEPEEKVIEYVKSIVNVPYSHFVDYLSCVPHHVIADTEIPQHSNLETASITLCNAFFEKGFPICDTMAEIGKIIDPQEKDNGAHSKYGETGIKLAQIYGLSFLRADGKWDLTYVGKIFHNLTETECKKFRVRSILRNNFFSQLVLDAMKKDIVLNDYLSPLFKPTTCHRRSSNIRKVLDEIVTECRNDNVDLKNIIKDSDENEDNAFSLSNSYADSTRLLPLSALLTKPFLLLAGISGTGKSRIVRELARACWKPDSEEFKAHKPSNFEMIQVKPNWHDSSELLGYVSRIGGKPEFVAGDFLRFIVKAWENRNVPCFLCLDEMNLAPVEQYFAEYLSVIETRKLENGEIVTDPILKVNVEQWYIDLIHKLTSDEILSKQFLERGIAIPQNLFVVGTVNMDETTFSFSRKVLDRAMTIEMNEVDLEGGLENDGGDGFGYIGEALHVQFVEGKDVYSDYKELCDKVITYLKSVNEKLEGTPFKIAYRTRNEFLVYAVNRWLLSDGQDVFLNAIDEMTSMKILSRIEGDVDKVGSVLDDLKSLLEGAFGESELKTSSVSLSKLKEMTKKLEKTQYTSFWL